MRVMVVDDEPLSLKALTTILASRSDVERFDLANDAIDALEKIQSNTYDVLLLDINMPELSGIGMLDRLGQRGQPAPAIIFVTAHDEHAIAAFEKHAVDYVLKPFSSERINEALDAAGRRSAGERAVQLLEKLSRPGEPATRPTKIAIRNNGRILFVDPSEIHVVEAEGNYVLLRRNGDSYLLREPISNLAEKLKPFGFVRIHRSVMVNTAFVQAVKPCSTGEYGLYLTDGRQYPVSRTYKKNLKCLAEFWIGAGTFHAE